jgi:restriction endonuclease S subunit
MSYAKSKLSQDPESIKLPGTHLKKILVDMKSNEESNQPRYVRHRRRKSKYFQRSSSESSVESCNWSSDEETLIQKTETESLSKNNVLQDVINNGGISKKNILLAKKKLVSSNEFTDTSVDSVISGFNSHIPTWGATFSNNNKKFRVINTCTIDNFLFAFWVLSKIKINFFDLHSQNEIKEIALKIINQIDIYDWDSARQTWYVDVLKGKFKNQTISLWGEGSFFRKFQVHALQQKCNSSCKENF